MYLCFLRYHYRLLQLCHILNENITSAKRKGDAKYLIKQRSWRLHEEDVYGKSLLSLVGPKSKNVPSPHVWIQNYSLLCLGHCTKLCINSINFILLSVNDNAILLKRPVNGIVKNYVFSIKKFKLKFMDVVEKFDPLWLGKDIE